MTPQDVARVYRVSVGYVYRLACEQSWRRLRLAGRVLYVTEDVDKTLGADTHSRGCLTEGHRR